MDRLDRDTENYRRLAAITHGSMVQKPQPIDKIWPTRESMKPKESIKMSPDMLAQIISTHGLDPNKFKAQ